MKPVRNTTELSMNNIVLSGSFYFLVAGITPNSFIGKVWSDQARQWGRSASVPLPSPVHMAYALDERDINYLFPSEIDKAVPTC